MRNSALRRPPRPAAPQLLALPYRERIEAAFRKACGCPVNLIAIELERNRSFVHGDIVELVIVVRRPNGKSIDLRHVMPKGSESNPQALLGAAEITGETIGRALNGYR